MNTYKEYFKRQLKLSEIGEEGQKKLQQAKILIIGCGGLGNPLAIYLATSGVGNITLVDFDKVSVSNLHRQVFYKLKDVGKYKAKVLAKRIEERTPFVNVEYCTEKVTKQNVLETIKKVDIVVDATDNILAKYLINDACVLAKKPLIYGALHKFDGYVATFNVLQKTKDYSCNLRDAFPIIDNKIPTSAEVGILNSIVAIIAIMQANEVIKLITGVGKLLVNKLLIYNSLKNSQLKIKLVKNKAVDISKTFKSSNY